MNIKFILFILFAFCSLSFAEDEQIVVKARQTPEAVHIFIINKSDEIIIIGDPEKSGVSIRFESDIRKAGLSAQHIVVHAWKHLLVLTPHREDRPHLWTHEFSVKAEIETVGIIKKMDITILVSNAANFDINKLGPLEPLKLDVEILPNEIE